MSVLWPVLGFVAVLRLAELAHSRRNARRLIARGAVEVGAGHYPAIVALHAGWLASLFLIIPRDQPVNPWLLAVFGLLIAARLWIIATLGPFWTTRILTLPGVPMIRRGPYRYLRHPNYLVVAGEIAVLPLAFGAWRIAAVFSVLNLAILGWRIRCEDRVLAPRRVL